MCIFTIIPAEKTLTNNLILLPFNAFDTWGLYDMLANAFPHELNHQCFKDGYITDFGEYENAIVFYKSTDSLN